MSIPCKLLGDNKNKRFWRNIVTDPAVFETSPLAYLEMTAFDFADLSKKKRRYRDKFAHLDSDAKIDHTEASGSAGQKQFLSWAYRLSGAAAADLFSLAYTSEKLAKGYEQCFHEGPAVM